MSLTISSSLLERIRDHGRKAYPHECCGLLVGRAEGSAKSVVDLQPLANAREDSPQNRYLISPDDWLEADRETRNAGLDVIGVYHSHPDHPARPSEFDREHAFPWYSYIIVNVAGGEPGDLTSWILQDDRSAFYREDLLSSDEGRKPLKESDELRIIPSIAGGSATPAGAALSSSEVLRYSRHLILPEVGMEGQLKLKAGKVLAIGAGGLGSPLTLYLAAAGVGKIGIVDFDSVDLTNLQRQILHSTESVGRPKLESAKNRLQALNPEIQIQLYETRLTSENALDILKDYDVIVDGTDNFPTRYLVNDACVLLGKPNAYGSIYRFEGQASVFGMPDGPCYRCLYPEPPPPGLVPSCAEGGVLGILPGIIGVIQATETLKLLLGIGEPLVGRLLLFDALQMSFKTLKLRKDPDCPICSERRTIHRLIDYNQFCGIAAEPQQAQDSGLEIEPAELKALLDKKEPLYLLDVREPHEWQICRIPGAHLIPLGQLPSSLNQLNTADNIVAYCRSGVRSGRAVDLLRKSGFRKAKNLNGGILAWSDRVDPSVPKY